MPKWMCRAAVALVALVLPIGAVAQQATGRPVTMIVNFPPGGLTDLVGRGLAAGMAQALGVPVVVQNRGGAGGSIGVTALAAAPNDGTTIGFVATASLTTLPHMRALPYRAETMGYVCRSFDVPVYLLAAPTSRFTTAQSLVEAARAQPGTLNYATVGPGSLPHLAALDWAGAAGVSLTHVPYQGEGPAVIDLLAGRVEVYFGTSSVASIHQLRRLGVAAAARLPESPTTPTLTELGYPVMWSVLGGVIAPPGMDPTVRQKLERACAQAVDMPEYRALLQRLQVGWAYSDGAEFRRLVLAESVRNRGMLASSRLLLE
jgi:tripartite-type tricarboxylate transporter receptor subunit TctC